MMWTISIVYISILKALTESVDVRVRPNARDILVRSNQNRAADICVRINTIAHICITVSSVV